MSEQEQESDDCEFTPEQLLGLDAFRDYYLTLHNFDEDYDHEPELQMAREALMYLCWEDLIEDDLWSYWLPLNADGKPEEIDEALCNYVMLKLNEEDGFPPGQTKRETIESGWQMHKMLGLDVYYEHRMLR